jgi:hypothetical protein
LDRWPGALLQRGESILRLCRREGEIPNLWIQHRPSDYTWKHYLSVSGFWCGS